MSWHRSVVSSSNERLGKRGDVLCPGRTNMKGRTLFMEPGPQLVRAGDEDGVHRGVYLGVAFVGGMQGMGQDVLASIPVN